MTGGVLAGLGGQRRYDGAAAEGVVFAGGDAIASQDAYQIKQQRPLSSGCGLIVTPRLQSTGHGRNEVALVGHSLLLGFLPCCGGSAQIQ